MLRVALLLLALPSVAAAATAGEFQVNSITAGDQGYPGVCVAADGSATVVWESRAGGSELRGRRIDAGDAPLGGEVLFAPAAGIERQAPAVACAADGGYVVVWEERGAGADDFDIGALRVAADGSAGDRRIVNDTTAGRQRAVAVCASPGGDAVVAWQGDEPGDEGYGIFLRRLDAAGTPRGAEVRVNATRADEQQHPAIACAADGAVAVAWESRGQDGDGGAVLARRVAADGGLGPERVLNATSRGDQRLPAIVALADGGFLAAWESEGQDGDESAVVARRLGADLAPLADELVVNACAAFSQEQPALAVGRDGVTVVWSSPGDGEGYGIFARQLDGDGRPRGPEVLLNTVVAGSQGAISDEGRGLAAAGARGGDALVVWQSLRLLGASPDGDGLGVFARRAPFAAVSCAGDCDGDGRVAIDELIRGVGLALSDGATACAALDADGDGRVVVAELIAAVAAALAGCPG